MIGGMKNVFCQKIHHRLESYQSNIKSKYINIKKKVYKRIEDTLQNEHIHNLIMRIRSTTDHENTNLVLYLLLIRYNPP